MDGGLRLVVFLDRAPPAARGFAVAAGAAVFAVLVDAAAEEFSSSAARDGFAERGDMQHSFVSTLTRLMPHRDGLNSSIQSSGRRSRADRTRQRAERRAANDA
jgi:hypothetical protein